MSKRKKAALSAWRSWGYSCTIAYAQVAAGAGLGDKIVRSISQGGCPDRAFDKLLAREPEKDNFIADLRTRIKAEQHVAKAMRAARAGYRNVRQA
jgi:hypothetical protein